MKPSIIVTMLIALLLSSPAHSQVVVVKSDGSREQFDGSRGTYAVWEVWKGKLVLQFAIERDICTFVLPHLMQFFRGKCDDLAAEWNAAMARMRAQYRPVTTQQGISGLTQQTGKTSPTYIGEEPVGGVSAKCWQFDPLRRYCFSRELQKRIDREGLSKIKRLASAFEPIEKEMKDPAEEWIRKKEKETKGYLVKCEDWRQALGMSTALLGMGIPDAEIARMVRKARDGGAQPGGWFKKVDKKITDIKVPPGYKKTTVAAFTKQMQEQMQFSKKQMKIEGVTGADIPTFDPKKLKAIQEQAFKKRSEQEQPKKNKDDATVVEGKQSSAEGTGKLENTVKKGWGKIKELLK